MAKIYSFLYGIKKKAQALYNQGNFEAALSCYDQAIEQNPTDYWSWQVF